METSPAILPPLCRRAASRGAISESAGNGRARYGSAPQSRSIRQSAPPGVSGHEKKPPRRAASLAPCAGCQRSPARRLYSASDLVVAAIGGPCHLRAPKHSGNDSFKVLGRRAIHFDRFRNFWCLWLADSHVGKPRRFGQFRNTSSGILSSSLSANRVVSAGSETSAAIFAPWPGVLSWNRPKRTGFALQRPRAERRLTWSPRA